MKNLWSVYDVDCMRSNKGRETAPVRAAGCKADEWGPSGVD